MNTLTWVLLGVATYWVTLVVLRNRGLLPSSVGTQGPIITVHTTRGRAFLDAVATPKRLWRAWGNLGIGAALVIMVGSFFAVLFSAIGALRTPERTAFAEPRNYLVIPGVNEFLPLSVAPEILFGLLVGLIVHEGGHGLLCRVEDIEIESMGIALFAIVPIGAFVQPDEESQRNADRGGQTRMFAAGVMNNFAVTLVAFALLFGIVGTSIAVAPGAAIGGAIPGSAADEAGIGPGDRIVAIDGVTVDDTDDLDAVLATNDRHEVRATVATDGDERTVSVERSLLVVAAVPGGPAGLDTADTIVAVDGEEVHTESAFLEALRERTVVTVTTGDGSNETFAAGAYAPHVDPDGPLAAAGAPAGGDASMIVTHLDGVRVVSTEEMSAYLAETEPGQSISVGAYVDGEERTYEVELGSHPQGHGLLGVSITGGITGLGVNDFGTQAYPAGTFLATIGGDADEPPLGASDTFFGKIFAALLLPIASLVGGGVIPFNFAGFTGFVANFYVVEGSLSVLGATTVFVLANALFWTGWINLNLGVFNCIPAFPLDGGHLLRTSTEAVISRLPVSASYELTKSVTISVGLTMLVSLLLMIFGQGLLAG